MSPPEVWGPAVWTLFHVLVERINENSHPLLFLQLFQMIKRICTFLPCPDCAMDATIFLAKIKVQELKTKHALKNTIYIFHNYVNAKKYKPLFNYSDLNKYKSLNFSFVINNFFRHYNTRGNMRLIAESFQRQLVVKDLKKWLLTNIRSFIPEQKKIIINQNVVENKV